MENKTGSILALDIGDRRIGVALAESVDSPAQAVMTLPNNRAFLNELVKLKHRYNFGLVIIGMPYTFAGRTGEQATKVQGLATKIGARINAPIEFEDERLTTKAAAEKLRLQTGAGPDIDAISAQIILTSWLARHRGHS